VTKQEFIERVAAKSELSSRDATKAVEAFLATVTESLQLGVDITFVGFGKFWVQQRAAREAVNPNTREKLTIPAGRVPKYSAGAALKQAVK